MSDEVFIATFMHFSRLMFECTVTTIVLSIIWFVITGRISFEGVISAPVFAFLAIFARGVVVLTEDTCEEEETSE